MSEKRYTLHTLNALVREAIAAELPDEYWVEAELSECRESRGHCYMELVEKDETSNTPVAKASAKCWKQAMGGGTALFRAHHRTAAEGWHESTPESLSAVS